MPARRGRLAPALTLLLCCAATARQADPAETPARRLWKEGQTALLDGRADQAIALFRQSLQLDPALADNHLSLAAAWLARDDEARAADSLQRYLKLRPDHLAVRLHLGELLLRLGRAEEARAAYEAFAADAQGQEEAAGPLLVRCHTRLVDIAAAAGDDYGEHLHRGVGLLLLARQRRALADEADDGPTPEALFIKAAGELALARLERPEEARPCWYLYEVWSELGQAQPAARWLRAAAAAAPFSPLTATERTRLAEAVRQRRADAGRK